MHRNNTIVSRQQTLRILGSILPEIRDVHILALQRYGTNIREDFRLPRGVIAGIINGLIRDEVERVYDGRPDVRIDKPNNCFDFWVNNILCIHFNKLDDLLLPCDKDTERFYKFNHQELIVDDIPLLRQIMPDKDIVAPDHANLYIGYHLNETGTSISRLFVTHPMGHRRNRWEYCFYDASVSKAIAPATPVIRIHPKVVEPNETERGVRLKDELKEKEKKTRNDDNEKES